MQRVNCEYLLLGNHYEIFYNFYIHDFGVSLHTYVK